MTFPHQLAAPPAAERRIDALDVVRGIAIMGTLGTNIWIFTNPAGPADALGTVATGSLAGNVEAVLRFLANGKLLALLTVMFGVGLELQYRSARKRGERWPGWYLWRAALLFAEGLLHYILIFEFDVLMGYAVTSMLVAYLVARSTRTIRRWMIVSGSVHVAFVAFVTAGMLFAGDVVPGPSTTDLFTTGSYLDQVAARFENIGFYRIEAVFVIPMSITLFLLGVHLMRAGVFGADDNGDRLRRKLMLFGFGIGVPLNLVTTFSGPAWFMVDRYLLPPIVALGVLGLVTSAVHAMSGRPGMVRRGVTSVGRCALSCYVFQNLLATILCYGWGFGLAATMDSARPWWVVGAWAAICATLMVLATLWLRRFDRGPLELAWHWAYQLPRRRARNHVG